MKYVGSEPSSQEIAPAAGDCVSANAPELPARRSSQLHWPEYFIEAAGLAFFMASACLFASLYEYPASLVHHAVPSVLLRRAMMGVSMGLTAIAIIYSPWGKQSGAHINPSITFSFYYLGKIPLWDALFYIVAQFGGAILGVELTVLLLGKIVSGPPVLYAATVPGEKGVWAAIAAEYLMAFGMMSLVLYSSNHPKLKRYTGFFAGILVATYITLEAPVSGMSMNPARTFGSAFPGKVWDGIWIYFIAPPLGMLSAAHVFVWWKGRSSVECCKLQHHSKRPCIFCGSQGRQEA
jgi:aquaporin Z